ncbi:MAG: DMT family transporter [Chitinophagaceae bacterium]|nr:DMT family transporter [Chitinophagaceae bacterium]MCW5928060.1 DMT family transporter [Chitinophagaceae bacterium]
MKRSPWLLFALLTTVFWGIWGALSEFPEKNGFPATLGYVVWAITMLVPAIIALKIINWRPGGNRKVLLYGLLIGLFGGGGQLILFQALKMGPAYLVFPLVSLSPIVTVLLSFIFLKEKASTRARFGIIIALIAIPLLSYQQPVNGQDPDFLWIILALTVFVLWGIQAYFMKVANQHARAESIIFYMTIPCIALIPFAIFLTDFTREINWGSKIVAATATIQMLNSIGVLFLVYAFRFGKAIIVSPLTNTGAPIITIVISLLIYNVIPHPLILAGMILALIAMFLLVD